MVQKVIEEHQGTIAVTSSQPAGTRFAMVIPLRHNNQQGEAHADA
jgi:two-component system sensor histidine kinase HydH